MSQSLQVPLGPTDLLDAFRAHYEGFERSVNEAIIGNTDSTVLARLGDKLDEFSRLVIEHSNIFEPSDLIILQTNISMMENDIWLQYQQVLDESHEGRPTVVETVRSGGPGRPRIHIDPEFLRWAYTQRTVSSIARFLGVGRSTVRNALLEYGISEPQDDPFMHPQNNSGPEEVDNTALDDLSLPGDDLLDPDLPIPHLEDIILHAQSDHPSSGILSNLNDDELDELIIRLRGHYRRAGLGMLDGMLRRLGHHVQRERVRASLLRIDPVQRVFERIRIRRRVYQVAGPNALWHHDGQHGLIRWGIVIHGFIDGYSRLITGLRASDNNRAQTVLDLFLDAREVYGTPSRMRGDHGTENLLVATWMEQNCGARRGSYIWGRSVHNVRIERLWVDVTAQVGAKWADFFTTLELRHGLDINNVNHIWLLHHLFLPLINQELAFFAEAWNQHRIQIRDGPNRSPADLFGFDMLVLGVRGGDGSGQADIIATEEELEVYGMDWEALRDDRLLRSQQQNNSTGEGWSSWVGRTGPPEHLSEVPVESPERPFGLTEIHSLDEALQPWTGRSDDVYLIALWEHGLAYAQGM